MNQDTVTSIDQISTVLDISDQFQTNHMGLGDGEGNNDLSFRMEEYLSESLKMSVAQPNQCLQNEDGDDEGERNGEGNEEGQTTLWELFRKT